MKKYILISLFGIFSFLPNMTHAIIICTGFGTVEENNKCLVEKAKREQQAILDRQKEEKQRKLDSEASELKQIPSAVSDMTELRNHAQQNGYFDKVTNSCGVEPTISTNATYEEFVPFYNAYSKWRGCAGQIKLEFINNQNKVAQQQALEATVRQVVQSELTKTLSISTTTSTSTNPTIIALQQQLMSLLNQLIALLSAKLQAQN